MQIEVPAGWRITRLGELAQFFKGKGLPKSEITPDGEVPCIHYGELFTKYGEEITSVLSRTAPSNSAFLSRHNDVLMPTSDVTPSGLATASVINQADVVLGGDILVIRCPSEVVLGRHLSALIRLSKRTILGLASGTTVYHIYARDMALLPVPLPPLPEQRKIAAILSSVDEAIAATEQVIEQTRRVKEGLLQELLTRGIGHTRFKQTPIGEIPESWEVKRLGDCLEKVIDNRGKTPPTRSGGPHELIEGNALTEELRSPDYSRVKKFVDQETYDSWFRSGHPRVGDTLLPTVGAIGRAVFLGEQRGCIAQNVIAARASSANDAEFIYYWFASEFFRDQTARVAMNAAQPSLRVPHMLRYWIGLPPKNEQVAIAKPLAAIDEGTQRYRAELQRLRQTKAGLLQDLLTGKVRVSV